ncbi:amino acid permease-associated protein [Pseudomonas putida S11]|nr:amino acid permease-associated protein [Pseudomonas putida S11]
MRLEGEDESEASSESYPGQRPAAVAS